MRSPLGRVRRAWRSRVAVFMGSLSLLVFAVASASAFQTDVKPLYTEPKGGESPYELTPLLSVKDMVPRTSDDSQMVQMPTIPDGLGALGAGPGTGGLVAPGADFSVFMNHEHNKDVDQDLILEDGKKLQGAIITLFQMAGEGADVEVQSGDLAYQRVFDTAAGTSHRPSTNLNDPSLDNAFARFCSGYLASDYEDFGFDRPIYFTGEESGGRFFQSTYDEQGGLAVAAFEDDGQRQLHTIPGLGHYAKENVVPVAGYEGHTVLLGLEDGPADDNDGYDSQLYMYVGEQKMGSSDPMKRNGLVGGALYALQLDAGSDERDYESGKSKGSWVELPNGAELNDPELEDAAQSAGAFDFYRIEDGDQDGNRNVVFDTTGGDTTEPFASTLVEDQPGAYYGRLYGMDMHPRKPTKKPMVDMVYDADEAVASGESPSYLDGNALVSMDNLSLSDEFLFVQEDATGYGDELMVDQGRDAQIWRFDLKAPKNRGRIDLDLESGMPIAESECIYGGGRNGTCDDSPSGNAPQNGTWESSGIIDTDDVLGDGTLLFDVQAHDQEPPFPQDPDYGVDDEDGQLMLLTPKSAAADSHPGTGGSKGKGKGKGKGKDRS